MTKRLISFIITVVTGALSISDSGVSVGSFKFLFAFFVSGFSPFSGASPLHSVIVVIHDDNNYQFSDRNREAQSGAEQAYQAGKYLGESCTGCEVFVFRQQKVKRNIFGKRKKTASLDLYRKGRFEGRLTFHRESAKEPFLKEEARLYGLNSRTMASDSPKYHRLFIYFGHKLPEVPTKGYSRSFPEESYGLPLMEKGLVGFKKDDESRSFDGIFMSTCHGATPLAAYLFKSHADYLVASPGRLNLAYFSLKTFGEKLSGDEKSEIRPLLESLAFDIFGALRDLKSAVTVALFDLRGFPEDSVLLDLYQGRLADYGGGDLSGFSYGDCQESFPEIQSLLADTSKTLFHKPPAFGPGRNRISHSGWGCPFPLKDSPLLRGE